MERKDRSVFFLGLGLFVNTIIGVGIFGLPYVASRSGFLPVLGYFLILSSVVYVIHRIYIEVVLHTEGQHRFPGYVGYWLGPAWKKFAYGANIIGITAALVAYIIVGGTFFASVIQKFVDIPTTVAIVAFGIIGSVIVFRGRRTVAKTELTFLFIFIVLIGTIVALGWRHISLQNIAGFHALNVFLPYGIVFFSFWGSSIIPELVELTGRKSPDLIKRILLWGTGISLVAYTLFTFVVLGITGAATSPEAIPGLEGILGNGVITIGYLLGIVTTFTSFMSLGLTLQRVYAYDVGLPKITSWLLACGIPLTLLLIGLRDYIGIVTFVGALLLGFEGLMLFMVYRKVQKKIQFGKQLRLGWVWAISLFFAIGVVAEVYYFIRDIIS